MWKNSPSREVTREGEEENDGGGKEEDTQCKENEESARKAMEKEGKLRSVKSHTEQGRSHRSLLHYR